MMQELGALRIKLKIIFKSREVSDQANSSDPGSPGSLVDPCASLANLADLTDVTDLSGLPDLTKLTNGPAFLASLSTRVFQRR